MLLNSCHSYADDTQIYCSFQPNDIVRFNTLINEDIDTFVTKCTDHQLRINASKSSMIIFGSAPYKSVAVRDLKIKVNNAS